MPDPTIVQNFAPSAPAAELRLAVLDRAINFYEGRDADPDKVVKTANQFESFLQGRV